MGREAGSLAAGVILHPGRLPIPTGLLSDRLLHSGTGQSMPRCHVSLPITVGGAYANLKDHE
jgi:hypothetical protein